MQIDEHTIKTSLQDGVVVKALTCLTIINGDYLDILSFMLTFAFPFERLALVL